MTRPVPLLLVFLGTLNVAGPGLLGNQQPVPQAHAAADPKAKEEKGPPPGKGGVSTPNDDPFPSTYRAPASTPVLVQNVTIVTAASAGTLTGSVLVRDGKIAEIGPTIAAPPEAEVIDGTGKFLTPGVIDTHSHLGVYPLPASRRTAMATRRRVPRPRRCGPSTRCGRRTRSSRGTSPAA